MHEKLESDKRVVPPKGAKQTEEQQCVDEALYDTFPASDPAQTTPQRSDPAGVPTPEEIDRAREADQSTSD
jgi:hypothetical protein